MITMYSSSIVAARIHLDRHRMRCAADDRFYHRFYPVAIVRISRVCQYLCCVVEWRKLNENLGYFNCWERNGVFLEERNEKHLHW